VITEKYAVAECERRFLLDAVPVEASNPRRISDVYIDGTRLRVRSLATPDGVVLERKLGHKRREGPDPTLLWHTSLYLDEAEYELLSSLPGRALAKTRWTIQLEDRLGSVDVYAGALAGLLMLEVDLGDRAQLDAFEPPEWAGKEVTYDGTFTGGSLARLGADQLRTALQPYM
jgi:CYTH domain-containing protein